jgi:hypothetical protein
LVASRPRIFVRVVMAGAGAERGLCAIELCDGSCDGVRACGGNCGRDCFEPFKFAHLLRAIPGLLL